MPIFSAGACGCQHANRDIVYVKERIMAEELDSFLTRIHDQGIRKTEQEAEKILNEARARAEHTLKHAELKAEKIIAQAEKDAALMVSHGKTSLKQAARDVLLELRQQMQERMQTILQEFAGQVLDPPKTAEILGDLIRAYVEKNGTTTAIDVLIPAAQVEALEKSLQAAVAESLQGQISLRPVSSLMQGFKLHVQRQQVTYDFSDEALAEVLGTLLQPQLNTLIRE
jgi:V/A-type H+-transporting ATPase subunit E